MSTSDVIAHRLKVALPDSEHNCAVQVYQLFDEWHIVSHEFIQRYGRCKQLLPHMKLMDTALILAHSLLLQDDRRESAATKNGIHLAVGKIGG